MDLDALLHAHGGSAARPELVRLLGRHTFDNLVKQGALVALFPRVYAYPWEADQPELRLRAALQSVGGQVAISHLTALALRALPVPADAPLHVTAYQPRHPRGVSGELVVHRTVCPLVAVEVDGLPVVSTETAITTSWPLLAGPEQRAPAIEACRRKLVFGPRLLRAAEAAWWVAGVRSLRELVGQLAAGCESELELWGYTGVFDAPGLTHASRQRILHAGGKTYRLDMAYEEEKLNVELDGRQFHASIDRWEKDIARDLEVAKLGWQTIRFSHRRLFGDAVGCRRDVLEVLAARRRRRVS